MRARLKSLRSDDIPDLAGYVPPDPDEFAVPLVLEVGPLGVRGRERFDLLVASPAWLLRRHGRKGAVVGHALVIAFEWDYPRLKAFLARQVEACAGKTWPDVVRKVSRLADWEGDEANVVALR